MKVLQIGFKVSPALLATGAIGIFALVVGAQVQTESTSKTGQATREVKVERGEVVYVTGNDLVVKMEDGQIRHIANVPESARVTVEGKELGIHDLKRGMKRRQTRSSLRRSPSSAVRSRPNRARSIRSIFWR